MWKERNGTERQGRGGQTDRREGEASLSPRESEKRAGRKAIGQRYEEGGQELGTERRTSSRGRRPQCFLLVYFRCFALLFLLRLLPPQSFLNVLCTLRHILNVVVVVVLAHQRVGSCLPSTSTSSSCYCCLPILCWIRRAAFARLSILSSSSARGTHPAHSTAQHNSESFSPGAIPIPISAPAPA